jgi:hypothetical protein
MIEFNVMKLIANFFVDNLAGKRVAQMDHLVCFVSGLFALGVHRGAVAGAEAVQHLGTAGAGC